MSSFLDFYPTEHPNYFFSAITERMRPKLHQLQVDYPGKAFRCGMTTALPIAKNGRRRSQNGSSALKVLFCSLQKEFLLKTILM